MNKRVVLWGLVNRRERLGLSWSGWLVAGLLLAAGFSAGLLYVRPFLAQTAPVDARVLVVEGWIQECYIPPACREFTLGAYQSVYTTGGPITGTDGAVNDFNTYAAVGAMLLKKHGLPEPLVQMVPCHEVGRDRTYTSAVALREWFAAHGVKVSEFNIVTEDAHARRTRMLFQEAFGPGVKVGVIALPDPDYDTRHWWRSSEGVRMILGESIAYLYAVLLFHPPPAPPANAGLPGSAG